MSLRYLSAWIAPDLSLVWEFLITGSKWHGRDDTVEIYTALSASKAVLNAIRHRGGYTQTLSHDGADALQSVVDSYGRALQFTHQSS